MNRQSFGRRTPQSASSRTVTRPFSSGGERQPEIGIPADHQEDPGSDAAQAPSTDLELAEWKRQRRRNHRLPWRQISFTASACFGIAYFVLPDSVNQTVEWLLLALAILSFASTFSSRRKLKA